MKFGVIDEVYMNTLSDAVDEFLNMKPALQEAIARSSKVKSRPFFARITKVTASDKIDLLRFDGTTSANTPVSWVYEWETRQLETVDEEQVTWGTTETTITSQDVSNTVELSDEIVSGIAINLAEQGNVATYESEGIVFGVNVKGEIYPAGFTPKGANVGDVVWLHKTVSMDGSIVFFFDRQGTHDGNCS
ncbi:MAG: hypothetical protein CL524_08315 [Aequorivita sp.]|nr:hypothetical protein [Aequorivita sp.]